jgi:hypothetical protein
MTTAHTATPKDRAQAIIDYYRDKAGEFAMLKGVLCIDHVLPDTRAALNIDLMLIAQRMDEINAAALAKAGEA